MVQAGFIGEIRNVVQALSMAHSEAAVRRADMAYKGHVFKQTTCQGSQEEKTLHDFQPDCFTGVKRLTPPTKLFQTSKTQCEFNSFAFSSKFDVGNFNSVFQTLFRLTPSNFEE